MQCQGGYVLNDIKDGCIDIKSYLAGKKTTPEARKTLNFILEPSKTPLYPQNITESEFMLIKENEEKDMFMYI